MLIIQVLDTPLVAALDPCTFSETEQTIGAQYGIRSIPTLILFQNGREVARQAGAMGAADIVHWAKTHL
ncbi:MAG: hypothetical protein GQ532_08525 [Methylomarinum sp.]|nr:hypothetical protein [Methylomarinum sp.]